MSASQMIVGGDSRIGGELLRAFERDSISVVASTRQRTARTGNWVYLDLARPEEWQLPLADVVYIIAAVARQKACRDNPEESYRVNVEGATRLARHYADRGAFVLYLSTDKVFPGLHPRVAADAPVAPRGIYGQQKAEAEVKILASATGAVLRLSKVVEPRDPLFVDWIYRLRAGQDIVAFADMYLAPVAIATVVAALRALGKNREGGIWQLSGSADISYLEAGRHIAARIGADPGLVCAGSAAEAGLPDSDRPRHTTLDAAPWDERFGIRVGSPFDEIDAGLGLTNDPRG